MQERFSTEVIVLESDGNMLGRMHFREAQKLAKEKGLDLVQVGKQKETSVCKIMDRGKWLYDQKKKKKNNQKKNTHQIKEMQFGLRIDQHDQDTKIGHIQKFLEKGHDVRVVISMKGREKAHPELAFEKLDEILNELNCEVKGDSRRKTGRSVSVLIRPKKTDDKDAPQKERNRETEERAASSAFKGNG